MPRAQFDGFTYLLVKLGQLVSRQKPHQFPVEGGLFTLQSLDGLPEVLDLINLVQFAGVVVLEVFLPDVLGLVVLEVQVVQVLLLVLFRLCLIVLLAVVIQPVVAVLPHQPHHHVEQLRHVGQHLLGHALHRD